MHINSLTGYFNVSLAYAQRDLLFLEALEVLHEANRVHDIAPRLTRMMDQDRYSRENIERFNRLLRRVIRLYAPWTCPKCQKTLRDCRCTQEIPVEALTEDGRYPLEFEVTV